MTIDDIVRLAIESPLKHSDVETFCKQEHISIEAFCDDFARHIADAYLAGRLSYEAADMAIAGLFFHCHPDVPRFAASVFECFDSAEYGRTKGSDPDQIARPLVAKILETVHDPAA